MATLSHRPPSTSQAWTKSRPHLVPPVLNEAVRGQPIAEGVASRSARLCGSGFGYVASARPVIRLPPSRWSGVLEGGEGVGLVSFRGDEPCCGAALGVRSVSLALVSELPRVCGGAVSCILGGLESYFYHASWGAAVPRLRQGWFPPDDHPSRNARTRGGQRWGNRPR